MMNRTPHAPMISYPNTLMLSPLPNQPFVNHNSFNFPSNNCGEASAIMPDHTVS